jgi:hypothetical protein
MGKKRKIAMVVRKGSFAEVEELDDKYWSEKNYEERLEALLIMRDTFFCDEEKNIKKVVRKCRLYEEEI